MGSHMSMVLQKNAMIINFARSRVLIGFSCTVSEIQNTRHSQRTRPWEIIQAWFRE
ncbi:hypothetical protein B296_00053941 [Ensete ventricosum]|uniref:Uncharacterized protein n=1 Tax=Ensete ventricosum TaxID=4639 RepID=A0A426Y684_ENSVE|nr:hypothetical protein B296_00053941 [Ensete ventricosum]